MFTEMLFNSEHEIFLEAIDQYFEDEYNNDEANPLLETSFQSKDIEKETNIESMNVKFCETLDEVNEIKDVSTDIESDDSIINNDKIYIKVNECILISEDKINKIRKKIFDDCYSQIDLVERIKAIFHTEKSEVNVDNAAAKTNNKDNEEKEKQNQERKKKTEN